MTRHMSAPSVGEWLGLVALMAAFFLLAFVTYSHLGEDAFISYRYARNLAAGRGLVYNPGEYVEGYSNLLWVLMVAPFEWLGVRLHVAGRVLSTLLFGVLVVLGWWAGRRLVLSGTPSWVAWWLPAALSVEPFLHYHDDRGLETVPYAVFSGGAVLLGGCGGPVVLVALLGAMTVLIRPEGILFPMALLPALLLRPVEKQGSDRRWTEVMIVGGAAIGAFVAQMLFRRLYYGEWLPNTVIAKRPGGGGLAAVGQYVCSHAFVPLLGALGMAVGLCERRLRRLALASAGVAMVAVLFQMKAGNLLNEGFRYQAPLFVPVVIGCWLLMLQVAGWLELDRPRLAPRVVAGCMGLALLALVPLTPFSAGSRWFRGNTDAPRSRLIVRLVEPETWNLRERTLWFFSDPIFINAEAGRWVAANMPNEAVVAGDQLGQFGFYVGKNRVVIDLLGLMDRHIARNGLDIAYLRQRNPEYLVIESRTDETFWPREARRMPSVPHLVPLVQSPEFADLYRPRWFLLAPLSFSKIGFIVHVRADVHDGKPLEPVFIGLSEEEFDRFWRVRERSQR